MEVLSETHRASDESLMSEEKSDQHESPSSATSTSRLIAVSAARRLSGVQVEQGRLRGTPTASRPTTNGDRRPARVFIRRMPSPIIGVGSAGNRSRGLSHSSDNVPNAARASHQTDYHHNSDVFLPAGASNANEWRDTTFHSVRGSLRSNHSRLSRTQSIGAVSYVSRTSSVSEIVTSLPLHQSALAEEAINAPRISRASTRRSIGQEWTRHHWYKIKDLEQASERARRCSKLSSGFAPLMVFGGLVFVCIGISASTNTGKDKDRLKQLSAAPLAMGVFMLVLGGFLICTWFGCRSRARQLDQKLLHGSRRNSNTSEDNLIQAVVAKLYNQIGNTGLMRGNRPPTPTIPGVTIDGVIVHKTPSLNSNDANNSANVGQNGASETVVTRETTV